MSGGGACLAASTAASILARTCASTESSVSCPTPRPSSRARVMTSGSRRCQSDSSSALRYFSGSPS